MIYAKYKIKVFRTDVLQIFYTTSFSRKLMILIKQNNSSTESEISHTRFDVRSLMVRDYSHDGCMHVFK